MNWVHSGSTIVAAFLASLVEFIEALTVVLAVGIVRGWRSALGGTTIALVTLLIMIVFLGSALSCIPLNIAHLAIGFLLLLFGMRWLQKAVLRASGVIPLRDEVSIFQQKREAMSMTYSTKKWDILAFSAAFKITMIEGIEVVFIVIAIGSSSHDLLIKASIGAVAALIVVSLLGVILHRPIAMIPENTLKFIVGILVSAFGTFWVGEGIGLAWPGDDLALPVLILAYMIVSVAIIRLCQNTMPSRT